MHAQFRQHKISLAMHAQHKQHNGTLNMPKWNTRRLLWMGRHTPGQIISV